MEHEKSVKKTKLLTDLVESKAQACAAAEAGQQQALEEARNSALAQNQAVGQCKVRYVLHVCSSNTLLCFPEHSLQHVYSGSQDIVLSRPHPLLEIPTTIPYALAVKTRALQHPTLVAHFKM